MKTILKRWVALALGLLIMLHSTFLPVFADDSVSEEYVLDDIVVDPSDYVDEYGIAPASLGVTLSIAQIAAIIAAGAGAVYAVDHLDDLGQHLSNALNTAASEIDGRTAMLTQWLANAVNGDIALASAPSWITQTIMNTLYGMVTSMAPVVGAYDFDGYPSPIAGEVVPAGTPVYFGPPYISGAGSFYRSNYFVFDTDVVPFQFVNLYVSGGKYKFDQSIFFLIADGTSTFTAVDESGSSCTSSLSNSASWFTCSANGIQRYVLNYRSSYGLGSSPSAAQLAAYESYIVPGCFTFEGTSSPTISNATVKAVLESYLSGDLLNGVGAIPEGDAIDPDVLVGGLPDVWVGQGLGADVITFPDIMVDGSTVLAPDETLDGSAAYDAAIQAALEKLKTGELAWDDFWIDIAGTGPIVNVGEGEDTGPELQLPDWFTDFCKDILGTDSDRNDEIDSLLPGVGDSMGQIDDFTNSIGDQLKSEFEALDIGSFEIPIAVLAALSWFAAWIVRFFENSGDAQIIILLPMFIGLALLFIGRGAVAMSRVHAADLRAKQREEWRATRSANKPGGGSV